MAGPQMRSRSKEKKKDFVKEQVRDRARRQARDIVDGLTSRARNDVEHRLRMVDGERFQPDPADRHVCGTKLESVEGLEEGLFTLFFTREAQIRDAIAAGDLDSARNFAADLLLLPLENFPNLRDTLLELQSRLK